MNNLPGFTSESSIYKSNNRYLANLLQGTLSDMVTSARAIPIGSPRGTGDDICLAACICCTLPSPIQPECCGVCIACRIFPWGKGSVLARA